MRLAYRKQPRGLLTKIGHQIFTRSGVLRTHKLRSPPSPSPSCSTENTDLSKTLQSLEYVRILPCIRHLLSGTSSSLISLFSVHSIPHPHPPSIPDLCLALLGVANTGSCVGPQSKLTRPARSHRRLIQVLVMGAAGM